MDLDDMDNFIEYEDEEMDGTGAMGEAEREQRRRERRRMEKERRKALGNRPELSGIDAKWVRSLTLPYTKLSDTLVQCLG